MSSSEDQKRKLMCRSVWLRRQRAKMEHHGSTVSLAGTRGPLCHKGDTKFAENTMPVLELDKFPEDILHHIHSRVPLRDAARAACVSHNFLRSWRRYPNLTFNWKTVGLNMNEGTPYERAQKLLDIIQTIIENHSGTGVKTLKLQVHPCRNVITANQLDIWLQAAVKDGIVELALDLPQFYGPKFNFPCSLLSCAASLLQSLSLSYCAFCPTLMVGCLRNLKSVCLTVVHITEEELGCLFSCALCLEKLEVSQCDDITFLKIPSHLQQLHILRVFLCRRLQGMTMNGECCSGIFHYALTKLYSIASNLQTLILLSSKEAFDMPAPSHKFLHLRHLKIYCANMKSFDFFSLVSFLKACPVVENFFLSAGRPYIVRQEESILEDSNSDPSRIRCFQEFYHDNLKKVSISGFCSAKSLIELTCQILGTSPSLQCLVLDTTGGYDNTGICENMDRKAIMEALRGVEAIKRYVKGKVPSSVNFKVLEPCDRCHIPKLDVSMQVSDVRGRLA
ncbi:unnamed protein product [Urochloa decumbens]|uniref:F-box domain-containing protein n=1 Tax=Urochloa decumbens TaxID=240449 RepID=A0ABC9E3X8_9POAL